MHKLTILLSLLATPVLSSGYVGMNLASYHVNALTGIAEPEAWVKAAKEVQRLTVTNGFPQGLAEALLDMKAAEVGND